LLKFCSDDEMELLELAAKQAHVKMTPNKPSSVRPHRYQTIESAIAALHDLGELSHEEIMEFLESVEELSPEKDLCPEGRPLSPKPARQAVNASQKRPESIRLPI
jgi:hypothetical protein